MEYLVPLMPLMASLPIAVAAVVVARMWLRARELRGSLADQVADLEGHVETLRHAQLELQERLEFTERLLAQARDQGRLPPS